MPGTHYKMISPILYPVSPSTLSSAKPRCFDGTAVCFFSRGNIDLTTGAEPIQKICRKINQIRSFRIYPKCFRVGGTQTTAEDAGNGLCLAKGVSQSGATLTSQHAAEPMKPFANTPVASRLLSGTFVYTDVRI